MPSWDDGRHNYNRYILQRYILTAIVHNVYQRYIFQIFDISIHSSKEIVFQSTASSRVIIGNETIICNDFIYCPRLVFEVFLDI